MNEERHECSRDARAIGRNSGPHQKSTLYPMATDDARLSRTFVAQETSLCNHIW